MLDAAAGRIAHPVVAAGAAIGPNGEQFTPRNIELVGLLGSDAMEQHFASASIFVSPALYEPFGLTVLEAAQRGAALVLSDIATFRELWDEAALFVPPGDAVALALVLNKVVGDTNLRRKLGGRARVRSQRYSMLRCVEATVQVYQQLLPDSPRGQAHDVAAGMR